MSQVNNLDRPRAIEVDGDRLHTYDPSGRDGDAHVFTSAGVTAGIDLALSVVAQDHGKQVAVDVAKVLLVVSALWIYAMRRTPRHTTPEQAKALLELALSNYEKK